MLKNNLLSKFVLLCAVLLAGAGTAWAAEVTDELTVTTFGASGTNYAVYSNKKATSDAVYYGQMAGGNSSIQMRSNNSNSGIVTTASGGKLKSIKIEWNSNTNSAREIEVFGKNTAYSTPSDLYGTSQGTILGTAKMSDGTKTIEVTDDYTFFGIRSKSGALYIDKITVVWETSGGGDTPEPGTVAAPTFSPAAGAVAYGTTVTLTQEDAAIIMYTTDGTDPSYENLVGEEYTSPIAITVATTIKAIAVDDKGNESSVATATYTIAAPAAPVISPDGGKVVAGSKVTLAADVDMILYTTDGTTPSYENNVGEIYTEAITITEACTLKAIAVDNGGNESEVATATFAIKVEGELTIDFESALSEYEDDWEFSNININNSAITAHGGNKYGTNTNASGNATSTASIITKKTIANPESFTCYLSKASNNTTESSWDIQVSTDGGTFTKVATQSATSMTKGEWVKFSADLTDYHNVYVRIVYGNTNAIRAIDDISLTEVTPKNVATPTFSVSDGDFFEAQNVTIACTTDGAEIYYTLDGTTPSNTSTKYTGAIPVSTTTTIKAIAYKGSDDSNVATVTLTFPTVYNGIGDLITAGESGYLKLTNAQVYYVGTNDIYIGDATGALDFYKTDLSYTAGQRLNGIAKVTYTLYNSIPEVTAVAENSWVASEGTPEAITKTVQTITAADVNHLVEVVGTVGGTSDNYYLADDDNNTVQFYDKFKVTTISDLVGKKVAAKGIVVIYKGETEVAPISLDVVLGTKSVTIGTAGYATFSHSAAVSFLGSGVTAYTVKVTDGVAKLTQVDKAPAGAAVVLEAEPGTYELSEIEEVGALENNDLKVSDGTVTGGESIFVLADGNNGVGFYRVAETVTIPAGKAYLQFANAARSFIGFDNETTGIKTMSDAQSTMNHEVYDLQGRRVAQPTKGLYIVNGKKMVIK